MDRAELPIYVIFRSPRDFPDRYVLKVQRVSRDGIKIDPKPLLVAPLQDGVLDAIREELLAKGLHRLDRHKDDDPVIVETWV